MARAARARWQTWLQIGLLIGFIVGANFLAEQLQDALDIEIRPGNEDLVHRLIMSTAVGYVILLAIPFVPGVELGLAMIGILGPKIVPLIYLCTVVGLVLSFVIGRFVPLVKLAAFVDALRLSRTAKLLRTIEPLDRRTRLELLIENAPAKVVPLLLRHRYAALGLALNLPGNFLIGGGGGIALVAGVSGLYSTAGFITTVALAVSPMPIAIYLFGVEIVPK